MAESSRMLLTSFWNSPEQLSTALRWITIVGVFLTAAFAIAAYFINDRIGSLQANLILNQGGAIKEQKDIVGSQSQIISEQRTQITNLSSDLKSVREQASELATRAQNAERGVSDTYDFNGAHRQSLGGGRTVMGVGEEINVFRRIIKLQEDKGWSELRDVCEKQINMTPKWLTPYMFSGIAYANLGDLSKAKERLEYVVTEAGSDPNYSDASRLLAEVRSAMQR